MLLLLVVDVCPAGAVLFEQHQARQLHCCCAQFWSGGASAHVLAPATEMLGMREHATAVARGLLHGIAWQQSA
jgi:hypothetical protein